MTQAAALYACLYAREFPVQALLRLRPELREQPCVVMAGAAPREGRIARANWWFARMRTIVENAMDWSAAAEPRPEQIWIPGAHREVKV